jgi:hypothetical protein
MGVVAKEYITKLGCEKIFSQGHILSTINENLFTKATYFTLLRKLGN